MIVSHRHKFIFIKTNKTAGTSVEIALSKLCGPDDIITEISPEDELLRQSLGYRGPQNFSVQCTDSSAGYYNHMPASEIRACVGQATWAEYFKFCIERNPWERATSLYYWLYRENSRPDFSEFLRSEKLDLLVRNGRNAYTINGQVCVDFICQHASLEYDLNQVLAKLGISTPISLPLAKSRFTDRDISNQQRYSAEDVALIEELFQNEIRQFGYSFN